MAVVVDDFTTVTNGPGEAVTVAFDGDDVTGDPVGGVPVAVAVFVTIPASTSACVTAYDAVHVTDPPIARLTPPFAMFVGPHVITPNVPVPENATSFTVTLLNATLPVLVTRKLYVTAAPAAPTVAGFADFTTVNAGAGVTGMTTVDGALGGVGGPLGGVPTTVAESATVGLS